MKKLIGIMAAVVITAAAAVGFTVAGQGYEMYRQAVNEISLEEMVAEVQSKKGYTELSELPETYLNAVVSVEDHRFYRHFGLDPIAICRAIVNDIKAGRYVEGGSTITQQLAKNLYFSQEKKMERKAAEVFVALELERNYSKNQILELYVNSIYFGDGYYTAGDASRGYFDKEPSQMNEYESTLLAGVPNAPGRYAPTKNPELAAKRQNQVLRRLEACGYKVQETTKLMAAVQAGETRVKTEEVQVGRTVAETAEVQTGRTVASTEEGQAERTGMQLAKAESERKTGTKYDRLVSREAGNITGSVARVTNGDWTEGLRDLPIVGDKKGTGTADRAVSVLFCRKRKTIEIAA